MSDLAPEIWSKLPYDILFSIVDCLDIADLIEWSCVNRTFFPYASARVWRTLRIKACDIETYRCLSDSEIEGHKEALRHNIVHFVTHNAHRQDAALVFQGPRDLDTPMHLYRPNVENPDQAGLPGSWVRHLEISDRNAPMHMDSKSGGVLSQLFVHLDGLWKLSYDGKLHPSTLAKITEVRTLTSLSLRVGSERASLPSSSRLDRGPWTPVNLDLGLLATLPCLRTLCVGHLTNEEAAGLARSVMSLKLERLQVSTYGWLVFHGDKPRVARNYRLVSPLVVFLHDLGTLPLVDESQPRGFPVTLRSLVMCDRYYPRLPSLHQRLVSLITHCELLADIRLELLVSGLDTKNDGFNHLSIPAHHMIVSLQSWDQLSHNEGLPIAYKCWCPEYGADGMRSWEISQLPIGGCGHITNIVRVLDEHLAKHFSWGVTHPQQPGQYLRTMIFSKEPRRSRKIVQDRVVEVHWVRSWLLSPGKLSVAQYLRYIGFPGSY